MPKRMVAIVTAALALVATLAPGGPGVAPAAPTGAAAGAQPAPAPAAPLDILLTNDDGWRGPGGADTPLIVALRDALAAAGHRVVVVAPATDQSGQGGRLTGLLPPNVALNVNYPVAPGPVDPATGHPGSVLAPRGTEATTLGVGLIANFDYRPLTGGPGGPGTYAVDFGALAPTPTPGRDVEALAAGYVSVTPLERDRDVDPATDRWLRPVLRALG